MTRGLPCPICPLCDQRPVLVTCPEQAFCGNDECPTLCWDMTKSLTWNLTNTSAVSMPQWLREP